MKKQILVMSLLLTSVLTACTNSSIKSEPYIQPQDVYEIQETSSNIPEETSEPKKISLVDERCTYSLSDMTEEEIANEIIGLLDNMPINNQPVQEYIDSIPHSIVSNEAFKINSQIEDDCDDVGFFSERSLFVFSFKDIVGEPDPKDDYLDYIMIMNCSEKDGSFSYKDDKRYNMIGFTIFDEERATNICNEITSILHTEDTTLVDKSEEVGYFYKIITSPYEDNLNRSFSISSNNENGITYISVEYMVE